VIVGSVCAVAIDAIICSACRKTNRFKIAFWLSPVRFFAASISAFASVHGRKVMTNFCSSI
jgi:hypothetical protein